MDKEEDKKFQIVGIYDADMEVGKQAQLKIDDKEKGITLFLEQVTDSNENSYVSIEARKDTEALVKFVNIPEGPIQKVSKMQLGTYDKKKDLWVEFILFSKRDGGRRVVANCYISK